MLVSLPSTHLNPYTGRNSKNHPSLATFRHFSVLVTALKVRCRIVARENSIGLLKRILCQCWAGKLKNAVSSSRSLCRQNAAALACINLDLLDPFVQFLRRTADLRRSRHNRRPTAFMLPCAIQYHPYRTLAHFALSSKLRFDCRAVE